ncbi:MAG: molecular chaperone HscC [Phenylobacterium sp.]|uniref:Hsp70 family protein n=1 Tax=Phenylobacterium sp. TaxID=1871053 RepID=UPI001A3B21A5|nr:molecular chaperone HscC [Phenylobacterium sp.]MBL8769874.1 molecular chaperone HscC [Phenylobacterium sp.]
MIIGIDLGTTNSAVAIWRDGQVVMIPNSLGHVLTPSAVSLDEKQNVIVGLAARERQVTHPELTATAFKRYMGTQRKVRLGQVTFTPEELSAVVLRSLKADAEAFLREPVTEAVITVPAYFNDKQRKATRQAGQLAGLKVDRLINEPTAAALAYGIAERGRETRFLVFDLGGGTFDVSILEIFEGVLEVRASSGDNRLGGEDFNEILVARMRARFGEALGLKLERVDALTQKIRDLAERAKRALSTEPQATLALTWQGHREEMTVTVDEYESWAEPLVARLREPVLRALQDGRLRVDEMDEVILVGGATRMPLVRRAVTRMFGRFPSSAIDPDEAVARGAAIQAGLKARDAALDEIVLTDVCPYSLGICVAESLPNGGVRDGLFAPILERNTTVPASREQVFSTMVDNQPYIEVRVYQGESRFVSENIHLGSVDIQVPPKPAGQVAISCRFSYDINGLLEVDVLVPETGERRELVIADADVVSSDDFAERRARLAALKVHPRDEQANLAVLARAARCFESLLGDERAAVAGWMHQFEAVLAGQDPRAIEHHRNELTEALDRLEGQVVL